MIKHGVYAGSFDPITNGHEFIIEEASKIFEKVVVVVADNPSKNHLFTKMERVEIAKSVLVKYPNVEVYDLHSAMLLEDCFRYISPELCLIRGIRLFNDFENELYRYQYFRNKGVSTIFIPAPSNLQNVSSSFVKQFLNYLSYEPARDFVDPVTFHMMKNKWLCNSMVQRCREWFKLYIDIDFDKIIKEQSLNRYYHNACHIASMLENLERYEHLCKNINLVRLAILFHDIEKDVKSSISKMQKYFYEVNQEICNDVSKLIMATDHEKALDLKGDGVLMHDLDLMILASPENEYDLYAKLIRMEYGKYSDEQFADGRSTFLRNMIFKGRIFILDDFKKYEDDALINMMREIKTLEGKKNDR